MLVSRLVCDVTDCGLDAIHTINFVWEGIALETDMCESHGNSLVENARSVDGTTTVLEKSVLEENVKNSQETVGSVKGSKETSNSKSPQETVDLNSLPTKEIREWARTMGYEVKAKGRISDDLVQLWLNRKDNKGSEVKGTWKEILTTEETLVS